MKVEKGINAPAGIRTRVVPLDGASLGVKALNAWPDYTTGALLI